MADKLNKMEGTGGNGALSRGINSFNKAEDGRNVFLGYVCRLGLEARSLSLNCRTVLLLLTAYLLKGSNTYLTMGVITAITSNMDVHITTNASWMIA